MNYRTSLSLIPALALILACNNTKKSTVSSSIPEPAIQLDTIHVVSKEPVKREVYRESNPRSGDVLHTKLEVNFDWENSRMNGVATIDLKQHFYPSDKLYLDARGMDIKSLKVFDINATINPIEIKDASWKYENDSIKVSLGRVFTADEKFRVIIDYVAKPNELKKAGGSAAIMDDKGLYFINPKGENPFKMPQIWTQGETQATSVWMPTTDSPNERMTQEILMTVDEKYTTLSNGLLISSTKLPNGKRLDHWKIEQPHAPYLAMMAVGEFKKVVDEPWNGKEISYYVEKEYEPYAKEMFGMTKEMIELFSAKLGTPYEWPKYSQIVVRDYVSGAMENTSATLHGDFMVYQTSREMLDHKKGESVIAHELFHQWFGDLVTCESWSNLPLNESFATYSEYIWFEHKYGRDVADYYHHQSRQGYIHSGKEVNLIRFNYKDKEDMFDAFSYNKGGQVLHMLRKVVGDEAFFASLKNYLQTNKFKAVEIHNLRLAFEETTGRDMNWFFDQWFLNKGRPSLKVTKTHSSPNTVELTVEQTQDFKQAPLYRLPLEVDLYMNGKAERKHIEITEQKQTFTLTAQGVIQLVNFDAERQLLCNLEYAKSKEEYIFQLKNAPLWEDRYEALKELESHISDEDVFTLYVETALKDKSHHIRNFAFSKFDKAPSAYLDKIKSTLKEIYANDQKTYTRAKALSSLNKKFLNDPDIVQLNHDALKEQSYAIIAEGLDALSKIDPNIAMKAAKGFEKERGKDIIFAVANLYSNHGGDGEIPFFHESIRYVNGFELMGFCAAYSKTAKRCTTATNAIAAATDMEFIAKGANKYVKYAALKSIKDIADAWNMRENRAQMSIEAARKDNKDTSAAEAELKTAREVKEAVTQIYARASK